VNDRLSHRHRAVACFTVLKQFFVTTPKVLTSPLSKPHAMPRERAGPNNSSGQAVPANAPVSSAWRGSISTVSTDQARRWCLVRRAERSSIAGFGASQSLAIQTGSHGRSESLGSKPEAPAMYGTNVPVVAFLSLTSCTRPNQRPLVLASGSSRARSAAYRVQTPKGESVIDNASAYLMMRGSRAGSAAATI